MSLVLGLTAACGYLYVEDPIELMLDPKASARSRCLAARLAAQLQCNCLVLTFVSAHKLNVDFFRAGKVAVDLGTLQR